MKKNIYTLSFIICLLFSLQACSVSYKLSGTSIDYTRIKSISIHEFNNLAPLVYPPLANRFTEDLRDNFQKRTRLELLRDNGDLDLDGEIVGYDLAPEAVQENAFAQKTRFTIRVKVRYTNRVNEKENFEREFSSYTTFDNTQMFPSIQDDLIQELTKDIIQQIFNATVENW